MEIANITNLKDKNGEAFFEDDKLVDETFAGRCPVIASAEDISDEGALTLASVILEHAYNSYASSIKLAMDAYRRKDVSPRAFQSFLTALAVMKSEENFYYSSDFRIFSLGLVDPETVIEKIRAKNGFDKDILSYLE